MMLKIDLHLAALQAALNELLAKIAQRFSAGLRCIPQREVPAGTKEMILPSLRDLDVFFVIGPALKYWAISVREFNENSPDREISCEQKDQ